MKRGLSVVLVILFALASLPLAAQQPPAESPQVPLDVLQDSALQPAPAHPSHQPRTMTRENQTTPTEVAERRPGPLPPKAVVSPNLQIALERVRVNRAKTFIKPVAGSPKMPLNDPETELWFPAMTLQFRLVPPRQWDIVSVEQASVTQAVDQNGQPLSKLTSTQTPTSARKGEFLATLAPLVDKSDSGDVVLLRTVPPPAGTVSFQMLTARFEVTMGYQDSVKVDDVRNQVTRPLLRETKISDLALEVSSVDANQVVISGVGNLQRVGQVRFADAQDKPFEPTTTEVVTPEIAENAHPAQQWQYSFTKLPERFNLTLEIYPELQQKNVTVQLKNLVLP